ncbi:glycoside hydrolase family 16 protein [Polychaeton citri CBS 116435]|uniref:Crh-like protein n=1 Tax=Polychaeton citri CBS 116435 TaxID=1314669 RepID=A0A9P4QEG0_9PEZI|nr:glycoside hydrolase family 16 protein [Polychaeton citri CBS 116435]
MGTPLRLATLATISSLLFAAPSYQQTYSKCNPIQQQCPPNPALGGSTTVDFSQGASDQFTATGTPTYNSDGVAFTIDGSGQSPMLTSNWYIMFGTYTVKMKAAPGAGIVSSLVLLSDDLDEIDWEWLGARNDEVQSNYFGKGQTTTYTRSAVHTATDSQDQWHEYSVIWTEQQVVWQIDGTTVRVLNANDAQGQFPQTPCQLRFGSWSGGDPSNPPGTIAWAMGPTDYSQGPFTMTVASISVQDYSSGTNYTWGNQSGSWTSIESDGGTVNGNAPANAGAAAAPQITATANSPQAFDGTHAPDSSYTTPTVWPWVASSTPCAATATYAGSLPSGWTFDACKGKAVPPSKASQTSPPASSTLSPAVSPAALCSESGFEVVTKYNDKGFLTTITAAVGVSTGYDDRGFPTTIYPSNCQVSNPPMGLAQLLEQSGEPSETTTTVAGSSATRSTFPSMTSTSFPTSAQGDETQQSGSGRAVVESAVHILLSGVAILFLASLA